ncbi:MAG: hypothetical protein VKJ46_11905 [Leptolyngbyaceae bacterium]|nr:hypothetical protein [Leptolyngbyaceae bacterium]
MTAKVTQGTTTRFITYWPYVSILTVLMLVLSLVHAILLGMGKPLTSMTLQVVEGEPTALPVMPLKPEVMGALRIDAVAQIPENRWVTYEIQLRDAQGQLLATGIKQAWKEAGTWAEDGESGSWEEADLWAGLDVRPIQEETVTIGVEVLEYSNTAGQEINEPVPIRLTVRSGVVDHRYLLVGLGGTLILSIIAVMGVSASGTLALSKTIGDSDLIARSVVGGANSLVKMKVNIKSDETTPRSLDLHLSLKNSAGEVIYTHTYPVQLSFQREKGRVKGATGYVQDFFLLEPRTSYGFYVEVYPDQSVDSTSLYLRDGVSTLRPVSAVQIQAL